LERFPLLALRPNCECCDKELPPGAADAVICSFECTFRGACADAKEKGRCPNCGGNLVARPIRPAGRLAKFPPSTTRVLKPQGCAAERGAEAEITRMNVSRAALREKSAARNWTIISA
jgi:hypothetical protein